MRHFTTPQFWQLDNTLPREIQQLADKNFDLLKADAGRSSLRLKKVGSYWSARVDGHSTGLHMMPPRLALCQVGWRCRRCDMALDRFGLHCKYMAVPKHIVAVAGLVVDARNRILMIRSPRRDWEFPGGQVEEGEDLIMALQREILEETGVTVTVGRLAGVYSNVKSHIVMFDFLCEPVSGEITTSAESPEVEWVERGEALSRIIRPAIRDRMRDMLEFEGNIVYRAYEFDADKVRTEYTIHEERLV